MTHLGLFGAGMAAAYVAGTTREPSKEAGRVVDGVSVKQQVLGCKVYNNQGEIVGRIDDLIVMNRAVTYGIVGVGGFVGLGAHDVAIEVQDFVRDGDRLLLPSATKEALRAMPRFEYAKS